MKIIFLLILLVVVSPAFAQSLITFEVDSAKLIPGEIVELRGSVQEGIVGHPVAVEVKDSDGNAILIRTVTPDSEGNFVLKFKVPSSVKAGEFDIVANVELEGQAFSESKSIEAISPEPEPEPKNEESICGEGTILKDGVCVVDQSTKQKTESKASEGGGCLIATATYGSELAPQVQKLREIRDYKLLQTESGTSFMNSFNQFYYSFSPAIADYERENPALRELIRIGLTPMLSTLMIMDYADTETEVLVYGMFVMALNLGIYFAAPAFVAIRLKK